MRAPGRIHRWVWHTLAHMPGFPLRRRSQKSMTPHRLLLRMEECERPELPGSILAVGSAFADLRSVGQVANLSEASGQVGNLSYGEFVGDNGHAAGYNIPPADSARWPFDAADTAPEARPAMFQFAIDEADAITPAPVAEPEPPYANPIHLTELNDVLAVHPLGLGAFAIGDPPAATA